MEPRKRGLAKSSDARKDESDLDYPERFAWKEIIMPTSSKKISRIGSEPGIHQPLIPKHVARVPSILAEYSVF